MQRAETPCFWARNRVPNGLARSGPARSGLVRSGLVRSLLLAACAAAGFLACAEVSEERAPSALCVSGEHWTAGDLGHPEMHPGGDCLTCHEDNDGPPLILGGTVYAVAEQEDDCYGEEGVAVRVTAADGELVELETNRAGNFYLEGDPSTFAKPYSVEIERHVSPFDLEMPLPMATQPETGNCGTCHRQPFEPVMTPTGRLSPSPLLRINLLHNVADYGF